MRFIAERQENIETHDTICGTVETQETQDIGARCIGKGEVECSIHSSGTITSRRHNLNCHGVLPRWRCLVLAWVRSGRCAAQRRPGGKRGGVCRYFNQTGCALWECCP